ncbi:MAG: isochorismatase family protein [Hyphomonadaceae bacterium]|jgi:ureidoacrylate peracid hydrolase|nr:isochorismatase family protein [Hyphomonadaceae bacterium]
MTPSNAKPRAGEAAAQILPQRADALRLAAQPEDFPLSAAETALIVVDMQNGYASKGGYLDLAGFDVAGAAGVIDRIAKIIAVARALGIKVIYFQNGWDAAKQEAGGEESPNWWKSNALKLMRSRPEYDGKLITKGTWDYEIVPQLAPQRSDIVIQKPRYSGFYGTQLDAMLRVRRIRNLLVVGVATNVCVESTIRDAFFLEYFPILIEDAAWQAGSREMHDATIYNVKMFFGWVTTTSQFCALTNR